MFCRMLMLQYPVPTDGRAEFQNLSSLSFDLPTFCSTSLLIPPYLPMPPRPMNWIVAGRVKNSSLIA